MRASIRRGRSSSASRPAWRRGRAAGATTRPRCSTCSPTANGAGRALPATGVPLEWERLLSAPFIVSERYGTRCSTVLAIDRGGAALFHERSYDATGAPTGEVIERFAIDATAPAAAPTR